MRGFATYFLALTCLTLYCHAVSLDPVATKQLEERIKSDELLISLQHIKPRKRGRVARETLFTVDFPNSLHKFIVMLDRYSKKVIVETVEDGRTRTQYFTVDSLDELVATDSIIFVINQRQPGAYVNLYVDCKSQGRIATPKSMRDMFSIMKNPVVQVFRERKYQMEVDSQENFRKVIQRNNCHTSSFSTESSISKNFVDFIDTSKNVDHDPNIQAMQSAYYPNRGDIPSASELSESAILEALNALIKAVNTLSVDVRNQHQVIDRLRVLLEDCNICSAAHTVPQPTCGTHPPQCFARVQCQDTPNGPRCGPCPFGYTGNGYECTPVRTCRDYPCFHDVHCRDTDQGYECGPCPPGYEGDGEHCAKRSGCEHSPCHPGQN